MMEFFNFIGGIFGYILWGAFFLVKNFGIAIMIFTIIIKLIMFPLSVKQQKSMAANARFQAKQQEILKKYANNRQKANEESALLMQKEGASPYSGCLTSMLPLLLMMCIYYAVVNPLTNTFHIAADKVSAALNTLSTLPGIGSSFNSYYGQIDLVKYFPQLNPYLTNADGSAIFNANDVSTINDFHNGFNFLGLDLLATPSTLGWESMLWLIPVLCFVTSVVSTFLMQKMNGTNMSGQGAGCMKVMFFVMPLFSAYIAYTVPAAVGFYWIASTVFGFLQSIVLYKFYNMNIMEAKAEAQRVILREQEEASAEFINATAKVVTVDSEKSSSTSEKKNSNSSKKKKNSSKNKNSGSGYMGKKK